MLNNIIDHENGIYALKTKTKKISQNYVENNRESFFNNLIKVSTLFHDLGKSSKGFQNKLLKIVESKINCSKLEGYEISEFFRHETISLFIVYYFFCEIEALKINDTTFIFTEDVITNSFSSSFNKLEKSIEKESFNNIKDSYNEVLQKLLLEIKDLNTFFDIKEIKAVGFFKPKVIEKTPFDQYKLIKLSIYWLVLTHHRLIGFKKVPENLANKKYGDFFVIDQFINQYEQTDAKLVKQQTQKIKDNFTFEKVLPSQNALWLKQVTTDLNHLFFLNEMKEEEFRENEGTNYLSLLTHYCRPFLVFSDYLGSVVKTKKDESKNYKQQDYKKENFANLDKNDFGDTLTSHLILVRKSFLNISYLFKAFKENNILFPILEKFETQKLNQLVESSSIDKFSWQNEAYRKILNENKEENHNFTVVISETGSGKTLGGVKIMKAISKHKLRFNLCLGLRTLTLQSGTSYREDLGLNDEQLGVIIGSDLSKKLYEKNLNLSGSDALDDNDSLIFDFKSNNEWQKKLEIKDGLYSSKKLFEDNSFTIIESPVVVCTVDQLIGITNLNRVSKARLIPRIFSSDLILDEIDNYNPEDLNHIAKLIYLFALYGRKVVIMSATVNSIIIESLYDSYIEGCKVYNYINKQDKKINLNFVSNLTSTLVHEYNIDQSITNDLNIFMENFIEEQEKRHSKIKLKNIIEITKDNWKEKIYEEAILLHNCFKEKISIKQTNINLSIGFIKLNSVDSARQMAYKLFTESNETLQLNDDKKIAVLCYHSKYMPIELDNIEKSLKTIINRKNKDYQNSETLKNIINNNFTLDKKDKDLIIIICTTSILEVGRDHDYDWSIIEPTTNKSIIQTVGRVLRHRSNESAEGRISILSTMIKNKEFKKSSDLWRNSGVYNYLSSNELMKEKYKELDNNTTFETMFDVNSYDKNIYSSIMFKNNNNNKMKLLEDYTYQYNLKENSKSIKKYNNKGWLNNYHYFLNSFRHTNKNSEKGFVKLFNTYYCKELQQVKYNFNNEFYFSSELENVNWNNVSISNHLIIKERVFLSQYLIEDLLKNYQNFSNNEINNLCLYEIDYYANNKKINEVLDYHPLLGFNYKKLTT